MAECPSPPGTPLKPLYQLGFTVTGEVLASGHSRPRWVYPSRLALPTSPAQLLCREGSPGPAEPAPSRRYCFQGWSLAGCWEAGTGTAPSIPDRYGWVPVPVSQTT